MRLLKGDNFLGTLRGLNRHYQGEMGTETKGTGRIRNHLKSRLSSRIQRGSSQRCRGEVDVMIMRLTTSHLQ
jgi:hypothetical protein